MVPLEILKDEEYVGEAFARLQEIFWRVLRGGSPTGRVNLFSKLSRDIADPPWHVLGRIKGRLESLWNQLVTTGEFPEMEDYTFVLEVEETASIGSSRRGILRVTFCPPQPTTYQRIFDPDE